MLKFKKSTTGKKLVVRDKATPNGKVIDGVAFRDGDVIEIEKTHVYNDKKTKEKITFGKLADGEGWVNLTTAVEIDDKGENNPVDEGNGEGQANTPETPHADPNAPEDGVSTSGDVNGGETPHADPDSAEA